MGLRAESVRALDADSRRSGGFASRSVWRTEATAVVEGDAADEEAGEAGVAVVVDVGELAGVSWRTVAELAWQKTQSLLPLSQSQSQSQELQTEVEQREEPVAGSIYDDCRYELITPDLLVRQQTARLCDVAYCDCDRDCVCTTSPLPLSLPQPHLTLPYPIHTLPLASPQQSGPTVARKF